MSTYFTALIDIHDPKLYERYLDGFDQVFQKYRGEVIAVEDHPRVLEGEWPAGRTVLIRFPDDEALLEWYRSPGVSKALNLLTYNQPDRISYTVNNKTAALIRKTR